MHNNSSGRGTIPYRVAIGKSDAVHIDANALFCFLLVIACCIWGSAGYAAFSVIVICCFTAYIGRPQYLLGPMYFLNLFDDYLVAFEGQSLSRYLVLIFACAVAISCITYERRLRYSLEGTLVLLMITLGIVLSVFPAFRYTSFPLTYVTNLLLLLCMMNCIPSDSRSIVEQLYAYAWLGLIYIALLCLKNGISGFVEGRLTIADDINPNQLAMGMAQMMAVFVAHSVNGDKRLLDYSGILLLAVGMLLTGSRSALIAAVVSVACVLWVALWKTASEKFKTRIVVALTCVGAGMCLSYTYLSIRFPALMARFTLESVTSTGGTSRLIIWNALLKNGLPGHYLFGIGFDPMNAFYVVQVARGLWRGSHNVVMEILTKSGIVGMGLNIAFFGLLFRRIRTCIHKQQDLLVPFALIVAILANGIGEDVLTSRFLWFDVGLVFVFLNSRKALTTADINNKNCGVLQR